MKKTAFLFPGQGSQYVGMAKDVFEASSSVRELFARAAEILRFDLAQVCFEGPEEKLRQTAFTQPAIFVHSCALDCMLKEADVEPACVAGHSLGEYSALVSAGALSFERALTALAKRSALMQADCEKADGSMAAVIGLPIDTVSQILGSNNGVVVANYNSQQQVVISGKEEAVRQACLQLKDAGAKKTVMLPVGGAYHSPLMARASETMARFIDTELHFGPFKYPIYSNISGEPVADQQTFKKLLTRQLISPVLWYPIVVNMYRDGVRRFVEIGPGRVLQGLVKRSVRDPEVEILGVDTLDDVNEFLGRRLELRPLQALPGADDAER